jgi:hypothetical protein
MRRTDMARVEIEGEVASVNGTGSGFRVVESWEGRDGRAGKRYFAVWFPRSATASVPAVGERVKVQGFLSAKVSERDARYVDLTVNEARVERVEYAAPVVTGEQFAAQASGNWPDDDNTPF